MRSITFLSAALAATLLVAPVTAAEIRANPKAVVELFTSQGCSSCPKADAMFSELGKQQDVKKAVVTLVEGQTLDVTTGL